MTATLNGQLLDSMLAQVPWDLAERVRSGVLADLIRLNAAFRARFGHNLIINDSYRSLAKQKEYYANPPSGAGSAAKPGASNHGWGLAVDLHLTTAEYNWMRANAPNYGWVNPLWAHDGRGVEEPWHWEFTGTPTKAPTPPTPTSTKDDDMIPLIERTYRDLLDRTPPLDDVAGWYDAARSKNWTAAQFLAAFRSNPAEPGTVRAAYQAILGRPPESAAVITKWQTGRTIGQVWTELAAAYKAGAR